MFGPVEILVLLLFALLAFTPIMVIVYLLYKVATKPASGCPQATVPEQIEQLASLKDQGVLSESEFEEKKKELLARM